MTGPERGFLLLTSHLGNPERKVLSVAQLRMLAGRVKAGKSFPENRDLTAADLMALGYGRTQAEWMVQLLGEEELLEVYLGRGHRLGCVPVSRVSERYPQILRQRLGLDSPGVLWAKGDLALLEQPAVSLVGSRELGRDNRAFAEAVGRYAAEQGMVLVSGNARGADRAAQDACLAARGRVISIVADELWRHHSRENMLYLSEEDYDAPFTAQRALSRNRCIHTLGRMVFVAQASLYKGGTWHGTARNLRFGWSPVACFRDGSDSSKELEQLGAYLIDVEELKNFGNLHQLEMTFL